MAVTVVAGWNRYVVVALSTGIPVLALARPATYTKPILQVAKRRTNRRLFAATLPSPSLITHTFTRRFTVPFVVAVVAIGRRVEMLAGLTKVAWFADALVVDTFRAVLACLVAEDEVEVRLAVGANETGVAEAGGWVGRTRPLVATVHSVRLVVDSSVAASPVLIASTSP
jgi:hypothetical protein